MSRRQAASNRIRGPQSALTDFLASNNISAAQINASYQARQAEAQRREQEEAAARGETVADDDKENDEEDEGLKEEEELTIAIARKKKKKKQQQEKSLAKIKAEKKKAAQKKAQKKRKRDDDDSDDSDDGDAMMDMYSKKKPLPGQLENCELCEKRFTVTPYSKTGPDGGLLCVKCSKEIEAERKKEEKSKKQDVVREKRRKVQSNLLDGIVEIGSKSLQDLCIKEVAQNINEVEEFGDLPQNLLKRLSQILSKRRILTSRTLDLFLRSDLDTIDIYDCGKLETEDYIKIFQIVPFVKHLNLRFAGQFKDEVVQYIVEHEVPIVQLHLDGTNLVTDAGWRQLFISGGPRLETLKLSWLDCAFDDETVEYLVRSCPNLTRLRLKKCLKISEAALESLAQLKKLQHFSLEQNNQFSPPGLVRTIDSLGPGLNTLSLQRFDDSEDDLLTTIHDRCEKLSKLRFTDNYLCSDAGFASLFTEWANPALSFIEFSSNRSLDNEQPDGPEAAIGLASEGFQALMAHSGSALEYLDICSCRHISHDALSKVFNGDHQYPMLKDLNVSFVSQVDTPVVAGIFKSCPRLTKLTAFGCFSLTDVQVPAGVALIGVPNAQESIVQEGDMGFAYWLAD